MAKYKGQTMIFKTLHRILKIEQHKPHSKSVVNSCAPKGKQFICGTRRVTPVTTPGDKSIHKEYYIPFVIFMKRKFKQ